ncbi:hypothetical protein B0T11DRAFT_302320 [Plectosphaerella cucumerina]|uniref:Uncharacterized protein n=1 Tax=Plectosphaerella cucumerina TaxID=40658 RepID=A0A8K0WZ69_9PEZI|nr:hypothetical protein B0T11DRAFT_302320 [Plectosphaerella cucumerina]
MDHNESIITASEIESCSNPPVADALPITATCPWTPETEKSTALRLEQLITFFDSHIAHSDDGLDEFILRHQHAMEQNWSEDLPHYRIDTTVVPLVWNSTKWVARYAYLVKMREKVMNHRLRVNLGFRDKAVRGF